jgi:DNA-binding transcriptional LysR family regulator
MRPSKPSTEEAADSDWNDLKVLLALSRGGSVAGAARALQVDQSTISRRLAALEESLGCSLLIRGGREFCWTAEGRTMIAAAEAAEAAVLAGTRQLRTSRLDSTGTVRVSTTPGIAAVLMRILPESQRRHPGLEFDFSATIERVDLAKGEADIAVRAGVPTEPDLIARKLMQSGWFLFASDAYLREAGHPQSCDELPRHRLILMAPALHHIAPGLRWLEDHRDDATAVTRVDNIQAAVQMALLGRGIVVLPFILAQAEPALVRVLPQAVAMSDAYLVYHESLRGVARIQAAIEVLSEVIAAHTHEWTGLPAKP